MDDDAKWINNRLKEVFKDAKRKNENDKFESARRKVRLADVMRDTEHSRIQILSLSIHRYCVPVCVCACACLRESVGCIENVQRLCVMPKEDSVMDVSVLYTTLLSVLLLDSE
ncbi:Uncharacterized protein BM_BM10137 [Brugia malayi]|uniref:Uncharacterized protein n=1 Tax=Brugia malayi TaxID=6279 RepID=A0A4E9ERL3_BRUMA|nr:Uncharacterized protein BM_BM10137 [Brugia malayi]VIO85855.1 Uncharacterized protein BM_BM10137 [Brugia malayi]